jgi:hypothetical protein
MRVRQGAFPRRELGVTFSDPAAYNGRSDESLQRSQLLFRRRFVMKRGTWTSIGIGLVALLGMQAQALPPNAKHIASDAKWFLHADADALRATEAFKQIRADAQAKADFNLDEWLERVKLTLGFNPLTDLKGITLYATTFEEGVAAGLIYAKVDQNTLLKLILVNPHYNKEKYGDHTIHTWKDEKGKLPAGCFYNEELIVIGDKAATVKEALDVLTGKKAGGCALVKEPPAGSVLVGAATGLQDLANRPGSQMLKHAEAIDLSLAEKAGKLSGAMTIKAVSPERATQMKKLAEGLKALAQLDPNQTAQVGQLLDMLGADVDGQRVMLRIDANSGDLLRLLKGLKEQRGPTAKDPL